MGFVPFGVCLKETNLIRAEQNYNAECCPYIVEAYAEGTAEELQKTFEDLTGKKSEEYQKVIEAVQCLAQSIAEVLIPILNSAIESIKTICDAVLHIYPNKRVVYLAMHHPKERVRKKNRNRIIKWINLQYKREGKK